MESFEFLGGRYNRPEQIMSGPVQAFRAQNAANGRTVFIHRVSTTEAPQEQAVLLKLMMTALVKSADVKRMVLDFGEEQGYWYVVTESEPQCALLREWLQLEIDAANSTPAAKPAAPPIPRTPRPTQQEEPDPGEFTRFLKARPPQSTSTSYPRFVPQSPAPPPPPQQPVTPPPPPPIASPPSQPTASMPSQPAATVPTAPIPAPPAPAPAPPAKPEPSGGDFTRLFSSRDEPKQPESVAPGFKEPAPPPSSGNTPRPPQPPRTSPAPGEFTSFFNAPDAERKQPQFSSSTPQPPPLSQPPVVPPSANPAATPSAAEPGEFTRFFTSGLPPSPPKGPITPHTLSFERTQNSPHVQRPNTPVNFPPPAKPPEKGEFTQLFSRPNNASTPAPPPPPSNYQTSPSMRSDPLGFAKQPSGQPQDLSDDLFNDRIDIGTSTPSPQSQPSEFTRMFGSAGAASPPVAPQSVVAQPREKPLLDEDPSRKTQPLSALPPQRSAAETKEQPANEPSEFTRIMQGGYGAARPPAGAGAPPAPAAPHAAGGPSLPPLNVNVTPANLMGALPHLGSAGGSAGAASAHASSTGASAGSAIGSASVRGPQLPSMQIPSGNLAIPAPSAKAANKKMVVFFIVIGVLAVLLILLMLFLVKTSK